MGGLIPPEYSNEILTKAVEMSVVMRLARQLPDLPASVRTMPVLDLLPIAYFVTGATGLKQTTNVQWKDVNLTAEELAVIVPVPQSAFDDASFPVWDTIKPLLEEASGIAIDQAMLYGTNKPASWPTDITTMCANGSTLNTVSLAACVDMYDALLGENGLLAKLEADGFIATGHIAHTAMRGRLRNVRNADGDPIFRSGMQGPTTYELDGAPIYFPTNGAIASTPYLFAGQWDQLVFAMRQDVTWMIADQGVIQDAAGNIVYNLFQQDMVALRMVMRLGFALPNPVNRINTTAASRYPFATLTA